MTAALLVFFHLHSAPAVAPVDFKTQIRPILVSSALVHLPVCEVTRLAALLASAK